MLSKVSIPDKHYVHNQLIASATWTVNHNLNKFPAVTVVDSSGNVLIVDVEYVDANTVTVRFTSSTGGKVYCN